MTIAKRRPSTIAGRDRLETVDISFRDLNSRNTVDVGLPLAAGGQGVIGLSISLGPGGGADVRIGLAWRDAKLLHVLPRYGPVRLAFGFAIVFLCSPGRASPST